MGTYDPWPSMQYRSPVEQSLRNEIAVLKDRVAQLEGVKAAAEYEVRLFVNDTWRASFKASDKIRVVEHRFLRTKDDRVLYARH